MDVLLSICVRGGSRGVPRKAMRELGGITLLKRTITQAEQTGYPYVVSTEDQEYADCAMSLAAPVLMRPPELATDTASKWDVFRDIAHRIEFDILADLDVCTPFRAVDDIHKCIDMLQSDRFTDVVITAYPSERNPYFNMVTELGQYAFMAAHNGHTYTRRQDAPEVWSLSPAVFAIKQSALFTYSHWSEADKAIYKIPVSRGLDIDTEDDFAYAEWLIEKRKND